MVCSESSLLRIEKVIEESTQAYHGHSMATPSHRNIKYSVHENGVSDTIPWLWTRSPASAGPPPFSSSSAMRSYWRCGGRNQPRSRTIWAADGQYSSRRNEFSHPPLPHRRMMGVASAHSVQSSAMFKFPTVSPSSLDVTTSLGSAEVT